MFAYDESIIQNINRVVAYANHHIYQIDDVLDMMNGQMLAPGENPEHLVLVPLGQWICYYLVNHPEQGLCHYFSFKPDATGRLPDKHAIAYVLLQFGLENVLLDKYITIDETENATKVIVPVRL